VTNQRSGKINATTGVEVGVHDELSSEGTDVTSLRRLAERGNGQLLEHVASVFAASAPNVRSYRNLSIPLIWLTGTLMLLCLWLTQHQISHQRDKQTMAPRTLFGSNRESAGV